MSAEEEDYLSDKFLVDVTPRSAFKTYGQRRKEAQRTSKFKDERNRKKSRRQLEQESRAEGLGKSLFERETEAQAQGNLSETSKALSMMMKMGFKPGQSLGRTHSDDTTASSSETSAGANAPNHHKKEPLSINEWEGKKGIGSYKRDRSPGAIERLAKMAKLAEASTHQDFRDRGKQEYEERRALARLGPAQQTCMTLDEKVGKTFNVLWLNPENPETVPVGFRDILVLQPVARPTDQELKERLRVQMQHDKLQPLKDDSDLNEKQPPKETSTSSLEESFPGLIEEADQFLQLRAQDRLHLVLAYLRDQYAYCFWCGVQYGNQDELQSQCPGETEDDHD
ncbi:hypothetical protein AMATHDRAFT_172968 [Amanita thiersii Skay4041]|uniref:G-patch domain-containing protein n=1 Tax=Amanita thiersii Skay4041 TaxID=703135 RepID=A0A2A9NS00_9AGAR|nr:hypothetical protein AMATHDRAFT_172968 [Amanita thiersii Skay4041]